MMQETTTVMIVEDEEVIAIDIQETLEHYGYSLVGRASAGEDALALAQEEQPDVILMDISLEGQMDGISAAARIRDNLEVPIIFLTSLGDDETLRRASITEPYGYILKPFKGIELRTAIELALHRFRAERNMPLASEGATGCTPSVESLDSETIKRWADVLAAVSPFDQISHEHLKGAVRASHVKDYDANEHLVFEGDSCTHGMLVIEGRVAVIKSSSSGKELIVELLPAGDPFGLLPTLDKQPYSLTLKAQIPTKVLWIPSTDILTLLEKHPETSRLLVAAVFDRLRSAHDLSRALAHDLVEVRVASALLALAPKFCSTEGTPDSPVYTIQVTRQEIAEMIGSTSETVIRITKAMERDGMLDLSTSRIIKILDESGLKKMVH